MPDNGGGITVAVRLRPMVPHEKDQKPCFLLDSDVVTVLPGASKVAEGVASGKRLAIAEGRYQFDHAMDSSEPGSPNFVDNATCYEIIGKQMLGQVLEGYNTCLFCYGQTGTGKTTTVMGDARNGPGLLVKLLGDIFREVDAMKGRGCQVALTVNMLEVYNETIRDLLRENKEDESNVDTHVLPTGVTITGQVSKTVDSLDEVLMVLNSGNAMKTIAATDMNPQSSRGHTIFKLTFEKSGGEDATKLYSEMYFADLAGHENEKTTHVKGERLKELSFINKSLMWLQNSIHQIGEDQKKSGQKRKPVEFGKFRNSKLTLLLANAMTGTSRVTLIVTLSPAAAHIDTSLSSLKFAFEVKGIKIEAKSNVKDDPQSLVKSLTEEVSALKAQLATAKSSEASAAESAEIERLREEVQSAKKREEELNMQLKYSQKLVELTSEELAGSQKHVERERRARLAMMTMQKLAATSNEGQADTLKAAFAHLQLVQKLAEENAVWLEKYIAMGRASCRARDVNSDTKSGNSGDEQVAPDDLAKKVMHLTYNREKTLDR